MAAVTRKCATEGCNNHVRVKYKRCDKCRTDASVPVIAESRTETAKTTEIIVTSKTEVKTLEDLIRVCQIDLEQFEITQWVCNKWEVAMKNEKTGDEAFHEDLFQVKVWLKPVDTSVRRIKGLFDAVLADIRAEVAKGPTIWTPRSYNSEEGKWLFEFSPFDLHMGKFAWGKETVTNYDLNIASDLYRESLDYLLNKAMKVTDGKIDRILCVFGNDVVHVDNKRATTTAGTPMDFDSRYIRVYRRACEVHRYAIDTLRSVAPVTVKIVPGNHDELTSFHLGEILRTRYESDQHVEIDNGPKLRKYFDYGINLFGFTHGDAERVAELPIVMAREVPELWAKCPSREWHIGHLHIAEKWSHRAKLEQELHSDKGIRIRRLTSLSAHDAWHTKHGYMDRRACEAFVFHKTAGFTDMLSFNVDHFLGEGLKV